MNPQERLQLDKLIRANDVTDNTNNIRELKHSKPLSEDIVTLLKLKKEYQRLSKSNPAQFDNICVSRCPFLFNNYTDIFNKVKKDEIDLNILFQLIHILKQIEDGKLDQHTGSYEVGTLKELTSGLLDAQTVAANKPSTIMPPIVVSQFSGGGISRRRHRRTKYRRLRYKKSIGRRGRSRRH